MNELLFPFYG